MVGVVWCIILRRTVISANTWASFQLKINYNDSLSAMFKKIQEFNQSMAQIVHTDSIRAKN